MLYNLEPHSLRTSSRYVISRFQGWQVTGCYAHHYLEGLRYCATPSKVGGFDQFVSVVTRVLFLPTCCKQLSEGNSWIHHISRCGFNIFSFLSSDGNVRLALNQELTDTLFLYIIFRFNKRRQFCLPWCRILGLGVVFWLVLWSLWRTLCWSLQACLP